MNHRVHGRIRISKAMVMLPTKSTVGLFITNIFHVVIPLDVLLNLLKNF